MSSTTTVRGPSSIIPQNGPSSSEPTISLTLKDASIVVDMIAALSTRGVLQPSELSAVGYMHDKFSAFLNEHLPKKA